VNNVIFGTLNMAKVRKDLQQTELDCFLFVFFANNEIFILCFLQEMFRKTLSNK